jgi:hypothetical protein
MSEKKARKGELTGKYGVFFGQVAEGDGDEKWIVVPPGALRSRLRQRYPTGHPSLLCPHGNRRSLKRHAQD